MTLTQITTKSIKDGDIVNADINASAAIAKSKLASLDIVNADINASAAIAKTKLASLDIVNADVNASAAIAGSKINPDFGSQNIVTTGTLGSYNLTLTSPAPELLFTENNGDPDYKIQANGGAIKIIDSTNSLDRLTINSSGNVGIGTTSPNFKLDVDGGVAITEGHGLSFHDGSGNNSAQIYGTSGDLLIFTNTSSNTERMRLDASGNLLVGTTVTSPAQNGSTTGIALKNSGRAEFDAGNNITVVVNRTNSGDIVQYRRNTLVKGEVNINASRVAYQTTSDYRLKENITTLSNGITRLKTLKPSRFNFKEDPSNTMDGFIAHELQTVIPEAVSGTKDGVDSEGQPKYQGVDTSFVVPLLTAALQEAVAKIETLEAKVAALEAK